MTKQERINQEIATELETYRKSIRHARQYGLSKARRAELITAGFTNEMIAEHAIKNGDAQHLINVITPRPYGEGALSDDSGYTTANETLKSLLSAEPEPAQPEPVQAEPVTKSSIDVLVIEAGNKLTTDMPATESTTDADAEPIIRAALVQFFSACGIESKQIGSSGREIDLLEDYTALITEHYRPLRGVTPPWITPRPAWYHVVRRIIALQLVTKHILYRQNDMIVAFSE
jgi:hypothetical protein